MIQLNTVFQSRSFDPIPPLPFTFQVVKLSWKAQGGPDEASISASIPSDQVFSLLSLLRAPLIVSNCFSNPVWWGFVAEIHINHQGTQFKLSLDELFNKVKVIYSYISPDNTASSPLLETPFANNGISQSEYGIKERVLYRIGIDDDFALALRNTFLEQSAKPKTAFMPYSKHGLTQVTLLCRGWFSTLSWRFYQDLSGYYANHGPGPGAFNFGTSSITSVGHQFMTLANESVKYVYFMLRKVGNPAANLKVKITTSDGVSPTATIVGTSQAVPGASIPIHFDWIKFEFVNPVPLSASTRYWIVLEADGLDASAYFTIRLDENRNFNQPRMYGKYYDGTWKNLASVTMPMFFPSMYFRIVTVQDTGQIINNLSTSLGQFFTSIHSLSTGVIACPYNDNHNNAFDEIIRLMNLGTVNQRLILAKVDVDRRLTFYEAPDPNLPSAYMTPQGQFFTPSNHPIPPYMPPIGEYAILSGTNYFAPPFDNFRTPHYFVDNYTFLNS